MKNEKDSNKNPIININLDIIKKDLLLLKNECVKDFDEIQKKISNKYSKLDSEITNKTLAYENQLNIFNLKITELSKLINEDKLIGEKVENLLKFKEQTEDIILKNKIKFDNLQKDLQVNIEKINNLLADSIIYPGIIGKTSKYKTFHDLIDYILSQCALNLIFREKNILDFKSYKMKLENIIKFFNNQANELLKSANEFTKKYVEESEKKMENKILLLEDKIINIKIENMKCIINLESYLKKLEDKINVRNTHQSIIKKDFRKSESINLSKRTSKSKLKDYTNGKNNINMINQYKTRGIAENKDCNYHNYNSVEKRKSSEIININHKYNFFIDSFTTNNKKKFFYRKSMFFQRNPEMYNIAGNNEKYLNNSDFNMKKNIFNKNTNQNSKEIGKDDINISQYKYSNKSSKKEIIAKNEQNILKATKKANFNKEDKKFSKTKKSFNIDSNKFEKLKINKMNNENNKKEFRNSKVIFKNTLMHYATIFELDSYLNIDKTKQRKRISEIRTKNNLVLTSMKNIKYYKKKMQNNKPASNINNRNSK